MVLGEFYYICKAIYYLEQHRQNQMARDLIHFSIRRALEKDGWSITNDPLSVSSETTRFYIDLAANRFVTAEKRDEKIAVEIKSFNYVSILEPFYCAVGKYVVYKKALEEVNSNRKLYLGITNKTYFRLKQISIFLRILTDFNIKLIIVDTETEKILQWIK